MQRCPGGPKLESRRGAKRRGGVSCVELTFDREHATRCIKMLFPHMHHAPIQFDGSTLNGREPSELAVPYPCCFCFGDGGNFGTSEKSQIRVKTNPAGFPQSIRNAACEPPSLAICCANKPVARRLNDPSAASLAADQLAGG